MSERKEVYALVVTKNRVVCCKQVSSLWQVEKVEGEEWHPLNDFYGPENLLQSLNERINSEDLLAETELHILCSETAYSQLNKLAVVLNELKCIGWQLFHLEPLLDRAKAASGSENRDDLNWLCQHLLPLATSSFREHKELEQEMQQHREEREQDIDALNSEIKRLRLETHDLKSNMAAVQKPDIEQLLTYLPIIFENFWSGISPDDFALLAGELGVPEILSPYPEPSSGTVRIMKKRFIMLSENDQQKILNWCRDLCHDLKIRREMKELVQDELI